MVSRCACDYTIYTYIYISMCNLTRSFRAMAQAQVDDARQDDGPDGRGSLRPCGGRRHRARPRGRLLSERAGFWASADYLLGARLLSKSLIIAEPSINRCVCGSTAIIDHYWDKWTFYTPNCYYYCSYIFTHPNLYGRLRPSKHKVHPMHARRAVR